jgi:hypothetical protein
MNTNKIVTNEFSNPESKKLYESDYENEPHLRDNFQCGGCSFYAEFNSDWGLCCHPKSRHYLETIYEHFTCPVHVAESWQYHSFTDFNAAPKLKKWHDMLFELPEEIYDQAMNIAEEADTHFYLVVLDALKRGFAKSDADEK